MGSSTATNRFFVGLDFEIVGKDQGFLQREPIFVENSCLELLHLTFVEMLIF